MKPIFLAHVVLPLFACVGVTDRAPLPEGHPAHPGAAESAAPRPENPFASTPTFALPGGTGESVTGPSAGEPPPGTTYTCPMHADVVRVAPGTCPVCGMRLRPVEAPQQVGGDR